jgi:hypothetical protein
MAGHLPLVTTDFHVKLVEEFKNNRELQTAKFFDRIKIDGYEGFFQRLPNDYNMDEETGLTDSHIFFYCGIEDNDNYNFEIHLDFYLKINQVYLVM